MGLIQKLPYNVANKISAGEVVQRPVSVVKELVENAIDAGCTEITLVLKDVGRTLIQVIDNGAGMNEEDATVCFERFATSKIKSSDDLENLYTFGFRGEALASIAAVSKIDLKTKKSQSSTGIQVKIDAGDPPAISKVQCGNGTSISVRNLFYNVPARRKFLKTNQTEYKHIYDLMKALVLVHTNIAWKHVVDGKTIFDFKVNPSAFSERINFFLGDDFFSSLMKIEESNDYLKFSGWLGKPSMSKRTKNEQFLFVNHRLVENKMLSFAIAQGYGELLGEREYPFFLINIFINPSKIDVNVHPSKKEIKFEDERSTFNMIKAIVAKSISQMEFSPSVRLKEKSSNREHVNFEKSTKHQFKNHSNFSYPQHFPEKKLSYNDREEKRFDTTKDLFEDFKKFKKENEKLDKSSQGDMSSLREQKTTDSREKEIVYHQSEGKPFMESDRFVWQLHNKYILTQIKSGLMLIDQHAAHERILYEKSLLIMKSEIPNPQQLLFPHRLELKPWEAEALEEIKKHIENLGFSIRHFSKSSVVVEGVPPDVKSGNEGGILQQIIEQYLEYKKKDILDIQDSIAKSYACRSSIMSGDPLTPVEMNTLIDQLFAANMPYVCPHGRPVIIKISLNELDKMFGRT